MSAPTPLEPAPPSLSRGRELYLKREDVHELGAFKWRGALPALTKHYAEGAHGVVTVSTGNHGAAAAWAAARLGMTATVFVPEGASRTKLARLEELGADVHEIGSDLDEAKEHAATHALDAGLPLFEDGAEPAQLDGYEAIGDEIIAQLGRPPAAVVVPVGNGALLAGVGRSLGSASPGTRRLGVVSRAAPVMALSWSAGRAVDCAVMATMADGLAVRVAVPMAVRWLRETADAMLQVSERDIAKAVAAYDRAGIRTEGAAAAALAALPQVDADGPIIVVVTGRNIDDDLLDRCRTDPDSFPA